MIGITNVKRYTSGAIEVTVNCEGPANSTVYILHNGLQYSGTSTRTITVNSGDSIEYWASAPNYYESSHITETNITSTTTYTISALTIMPKLTINCDVVGAIVTINGVVGNNRYLAEGTSYTYSVSRTNYITKTGSGTMPSTDTTINVGGLDLSNINLNGINSNLTIYSETLYNSKTATISMTGGGSLSKTNSNTNTDYQLGNGGTATGTVVIPANTKIEIKCMEGGSISSAQGGAGIALLLTDSNNQDIGMLVVGGAGSSWYNYSVGSSAIYYAGGGGGYNGGLSQCYNTGIGTGVLQNTSGYSIDGTRGTNQNITAGNATGSRTTATGNQSKNYGGLGYASGICNGATLTNGVLNSPSGYVSNIPTGNITITFS